MENRNFLYKSCPICGGSSFKPLLVQDGMDVLKCLSCSLILKNPQPTGKFFHECFNIQELEQKTMEDCITLEESIINEIKKSGSKEIAVLDVDCSDSSLLKRLSDEGLEVYSIVQDEELAHDLKEETGLDTISYGNPAIASRSLRQFDIVLLRFSLERSSNPFEILMTAQKVLKDNGKLIIITNNFFNRYFSRKSWKGFCLPRQLYYFSPFTIRSFLKKGRFSFVKVKTLPSCRKKDSKTFALQKGLSLTTNLGYFMIVTAVKRTMNLRLSDLQKNQAAIFSLNNQRVSKINKRDI